MKLPAIIRSHLKSFVMISIGSLIVVFLTSVYYQKTTVSPENRKMSEAKELLQKELNFSGREIGLLKPNELLRGYEFDLKNTSYVDLNEKYFSSSGKLNPPIQSAEMFRYTNPIDARVPAARVPSARVPVDRALPKPEITVTGKNSLYPKISVPEAFDEDGNRLLTLFEFDISPNFNSPNFWRYPSLLSINFDKDRSSRVGMEFMLYTAQEANGYDSAMEFPFRATNMRLPLSQKDLTPEELRMQAAALGWGLNKSDLIKEVFDYVRYNYPWGDDDYNHTQYDTFRSGVGECGNLNNLAGLFLELNGLRFRGVSGLNPIARTVYPGGGHSAIEVWNDASGKWNYFDTFFNILIDDPISEIKNHEYRNTWIYATKPEISELGDYLNLEQLFRFITYFDMAGRLPIISRHNILYRSDQYGRYWNIEKNKKYSADDLFSSNIKIFVRARYIDTDGVGLSKEKILTGSFSSYSTTSFVVETRPAMKTESASIVAPLQPVTVH